MSIAHTNGSSARIRILGCEPTPPPRRRPANKFAIAILVVAAAGVALALTVRLLHPQNQQTQSLPAAPATTIGVVGTVNLASWHPTRTLHRAVRAAVTSDIPAAARVAQRTERAAVAKAPVPSLQQTSTVNAGSSGVTSSSGTSSSSTGTSAGSQPVVGPELPPGPQNPGVAAP